MIEARAVSKSHGSRVVVDQVSLQLPAGGLTSIIGPNGAGKSSLLSVISRLAPLSAGSVTVDGLDVTRTPSDVLARRMSILRQENSLDLRLTVRELVGFGRFPHSRGRLVADDRRHIDDALSYLGLTALAGRHLDELSGGQRQRAFVAMVLCQDTDYVLLDEPLNSLDIQHAVGMMQMLRRLADERGKTIVLVLHDINFASCYSDCILAMKEGRLRFQGAPNEVMTPEVMREIFDVDVAIHRIDGQRVGVYYRHAAEQKTG